MRSYSKNFNKTLLASATGAMLVGALVTFSPWVLAVGMLAAATWARRLNPYFRSGAKVLSEQMVALSDDLKFYWLKQAADKLGARAGLAPEDRKIYDIFIPEPAVEDQYKSFRKDFNSIAAIPVARIVLMGKPKAAISRPLLDIITRDEMSAIVAHEFTHLKHQFSHSKVPQFMEWMGKSAAFTCYSTMSLATLNQSVSALALTATAGFAGWSVAKMSGVALVGPRLENALQYSALYASALNPAAIPLFIGGFLCSKSTELLTASYVRQCEYEADLGAIEMGAKAKDLILGLRKHKAALDIYEPATTTLTEKIQNRLYAAHPPLRSRFKYFSTAAIAKGEDAEGIKQALTMKVEASLSPR